MLGQCVSDFRVWRGRGGGGAAGGCEYKPLLSVQCSISASVIDVCVSLWSVSKCTVVSK